MNPRYSRGAVVRHALREFGQTRSPLALDRRAGNGSVPSGEGTPRNGRGVTLAVTGHPSAAALAAWDALVDATPGTDVTQLCGWGRLRTRVGFAPLYVLVHRDGELVAGAQVLHRRVPVLGRIGYLPYGPVIATGVTAREEVCRALGDGLEHIARRQLRMLFIQPPQGAEDVGAELRRRGFRASTAGIAPVGSLHLDLRPAEDVLRRQLSKRVRYWTTHWAKRGVVVRIGDRRDVPVLAELLARSAGHQGYRPLSAEYIDALYQELSRTGNAVLFVAEVDGTPVAADLITGCGDMLRGRLGGFDRSGEAGRLSVPAAIRWTAILWGKSRGYRWFDFGGVQAEMLDALIAGTARDCESWPNSDRAKLHFGATPYRYPTAVELIRPAAVRRLYDLSRRWPHSERIVPAAGRLLRRGGFRGGR